LLLIDNALNPSDKTTPEFTKKIGMSCNLELGIPSVFHTLNQHLNYQESIRQNILAGGDSCGRSILLGAILGAVHGIETEKGIPASWHEKLNKKQSIAQLMAAL
jgi:ADP-ribosylglycohydrolase